MPRTVITFKLEQLLNARDWTDYRFAQKTGIGANVIGKYRRNLVKQPDLGIMNTMCETLECGIADLLEYVPDKQKTKTARPRQSKKK
jgi:DNA-binding Xre family transcriptional regulator